MRAIFYREPFLVACKLANMAVPAKDIKPVLKNIKLVAGNGECLLSATDLEIGVCVPVQGVEIHEPGTVLLPTAKILPILSEARGDNQIELTTEGDVLRVRGLASALDYELACGNPDEFPEVPDFGDLSSTTGGYHELEASILAGMIHRTAFAVADESQRYSMTGILWELEDTAVRLVATDGRRLAVVPGAATRNGDHKANGMPVVPAKAMAILEKQLHAAGDGCTVAVRLKPNEALFRVDGGVQIYSRLVEGRFPDWRAVMPKATSHRAEVQVSALFQAVRQAAIMTDAEGPRVVFTFAKDRLSLEATAAQSKAGKSRVELPIDCDDHGKPVVINFNPAYVADVCKSLPADSLVSVELNDGASPAVFRQADGVCLVMPLT